MKTRRIQVITKQWLVLALASWIGIAGADATLDEQLSQPAGQRNSIPANGENSKTDKRNASRLEYIEVEKIPIHEIPGLDGEWYAIAYEANSEQYKDYGENETPAKLCFVQEPDKTEQQCFEARMGEGFLPIAQYVNELSVVPIFKSKYPQRALLFQASSFFGGSGYGRLITLWAFVEKSKKFINLLPKITLGTQDEYKLIGGSGDDKFSPHHYQIMIYQYDDSEETFELIGKYVSKTKYRIDVADETVDVISHEMAKIQETIQTGSKK